MNDKEFAEHITPALRALQKARNSHPRDDTTQRIINALRTNVNSTLEMIDAGDIGPPLLERAKAVRVNVAQMMARILARYPDLERTRNTLFTIQDQLMTGIREYDLQVARGYQPAPKIPTLPELYARDEWIRATTKLLSTRSEQLTRLDNALDVYRQSRDAFVNSPDKVAYEKRWDALAGPGNGQAGIPVASTQGKTLRALLEHDRDNFAPLAEAAFGNLRRVIVAFDEWREKSPNSTRNPDAITRLQDTLNRSATVVSNAETHGFLPVPLAPAPPSPATSESLSAGDGRRRFRTNAGSSAQHAGACAILGTIPSDGSTTTTQFQLEACLHSARTNADGARAQENPVNHDQTV